jgi:hypothetical protein
MLWAGLKGVGYNLFMNIEKARLGFVFALGGCLVGYVLGLGMPDGSQSTVMDMSPAMDHTMHAMTEIDTTVPVPTVQVEALKDTKGGYNIHVTTTNYAFTPEAVNTDPVPNTGHAHVYVNGMKVARLYGEWFNLPADVFQKGDNLIEVTLNANDHSEWSRDGEHIAGSVIVTE